MVEVMTVTLPFVHMVYVIYQNSICDKLIFHCIVNKWGEARERYQVRKKNRKPENKGDLFTFYYSLRNLLVQQINHKHDLVKAVTYVHLRENCF